MVGIQARTSKCSVPASQVEIDKRARLLRSRATAGLPSEDKIDLIAGFTLFVGEALSTVPCVARDQAEPAHQVCQIGFVWPWVCQLCCSRTFKRLCRRKGCIEVSSHYESVPLWHLLHCLRQNREDSSSVATVPVLIDGHDGQPGTGPVSPALQNTFPKAFLPANLSLAEFRKEGNHEAICCCGRKGITC